MLVLTRKLNETILIDGGIRITVVGIRGNQVRLGITAPDQVKIIRQELCSRAGTDGKASGRLEAEDPRAEENHGEPHEHRFSPGAASPALVRLNNAL